MCPMFAFITSPVAWLVIGVVVFLLFGNRLPSVMRSLGEGMTEFKKGLEGIDSSKDSKKIEDSPEKPKA